MALPEVYAAKGRRSIGGFKRVDVGAKFMARDTSGGFELQNVLGRDGLATLEPKGNGGLSYAAHARDFHLRAELGNGPAECVEGGLNGVHNSQLSPLLWVGNHHNWMDGHKRCYKTESVTELGQRIQERLTELGISQSELARRVGITQPAVANLIKRGGGSSHLHSIARALNTTTEYLTGLTEDPVSDSPDHHLSNEELKMLEALRRLTPEDRQIVMQITKKMVSR